jgi:hypothetical protein
VTNTADHSKSPRARLALVASLIFCLSAIVVLTWLRHGLVAEEKPAAPSTNETEKPDPKAAAEYEAEKKQYIEAAKKAWQLANFRDGRHIERVRLVFKHYEYFGPDPGSFLEVETTQSTVLDRIEHALDSLYDTWPVPTADFGAAGDAPFGELDIYTDKDEFGIFLYTHSFTLKEPYGGALFEFTSWTLAKVVDDFYFNETGRRLPRQEFAGLSGELSRQAERKEYQRDESRHQIDLLEKRRETLKSHR